MRRLWEHTEGWAGALRLASLSLRDHPDPGAFVDDFAGDDRAISDYLISEVMSRMSPPRSRLPAATSIVSVVNGELADALTGRADGHRRLADLARGGVLLAPLDRRGEWYRYHALFRELLQAELRSDAAALVPELHRAPRSGSPTTATTPRGLMHAVEGEAWDLAARLAGERWVDLLLRGEVGALGPLIERLPGRVGGRDPEVALAVASVLLDRGDRRAEAAAATAPRRRASACRPSACAASTSRSARSGCTSRGCAATSTRRWRPGASCRAAAGSRRAWSSATCARSPWSTSGSPSCGRATLEGAEHHLERARGAAAEAGRDWVVLIAVAHLAVLAGARHDYPRSARLAREAIALAERRGWQRTWPAGAAFLALARRAVPVGPLRRGRGDGRARARGARRHAGAAAARVLALMRSGVLTGARRARGRARRARGGRRGAGRLPAAAERSATSSRPRGDAARPARRPRAGGAPARTAARARRSRPPS